MAEKCWPAEEPKEEKGLRFQTKSEGNNFLSIKICCKEGLKAFLSFLQRNSPGPKHQFLNNCNPKDNFIFVPSL